MKNRKRFKAESEFHLLFKNEHIRMHVSLSGYNGRLSVL